MRINSTRNTQNAYFRRLSARDYSGSENARAESVIFFLSTFRAININGRRLLDDAGLSDSASDLNRRILWARTINNNRRLRCTCVGGDNSKMLDERQRECPK